MKQASKLKLTQLKKVEVTVVNVPKEDLANDQSYLGLVELFSKDIQVDRFLS